MRRRLTDDRSVQTWWDCARRGRWPRGPTAVRMAWARMGEPGRGLRGLNLISLGVSGNICKWW